MTTLTTYLINATAISALYALVAIGFTLIFGVGNILNLAHGGFITFGAFTAYFVSNPTKFGMNPWLGLIVATVMGAVLGAVAYHGVIRYIKERPVTVLIITVVGGFSIEHALRIFVTPTAISVPKPTPGQTVLAGIEFQNHFIFIFIASWLIIGALLAFVNYTEAGKAVLAMSMTEKGSALVGIDSDFVNLYTWVVAAMLATFAGVLLAGFQTGSWDMGGGPLVLSFSIVILGGLGSIRGSIVGAYVIGFIETATTTFITPKMTGMSALILLVIVLLVRPQGLFGREVEF